MSNTPRADSTLRIVLIAIAVIVLFPLLMMVFAFPMMGMMGWWGGYGPMMGGYGNGGVSISPLWGIGMMLLFLAVLLGIGYFLYRALAGNSRALISRDPALEELRLAYARGELSEEEFETRRRKLQRETETRSE